MASDPLILGCADLDALPLFSRIGAGGERTGYEPAVAEPIAAELGRELRWLPLAWADFYPSIADGRAHAVLCGQGITPARQKLAEFSRPYAMFDESLVVRADNPASAPGELAGQRI